MDREGTPVSRDADGHRSRFTPRAAALALVALGAAGCVSTTTTKAGPVPSPPKPTGELAKPAAAIIADARKQLLAAHSVRVSGSINVNATTRQRIDLRLGKTAKGVALASGTVRTSTKKSTVTVSLVRVGKDLYVKGDRAYYQRIGPKAAGVAGHWLWLSIADDDALAAVTDARTLAAGLADPPHATTLGETRFGAEKAVEVRAGDAIVYVASSGNPRLLRLQRTSGRLDFADYNARITVKAPAGAVPLAFVKG